MAEIDRDTILQRPTDADFAKLEKSMHQTLPDAFKDFMRDYNGLAFAKGLTIPVGSRDAVIERMLAILSDYKTHPLGIYDIDVTASQVFDRIVFSAEGYGYDLVPFAALFAGDMLVLDYRSDPPSVGRWDHERSDAYAPHVVPVADSFAAFLDLADLADLPGPDD